MALENRNTGQTTREILEQQSVKESMAWITSQKKLDLENSLLKQSLVEFETELTKLKSEQNDFIGNQNEMSGEVLEALQNVQSQNRMIKEELMKSQAVLIDKSVAVFKEALSSLMSDYLKRLSDNFDKITDTTNQSLEQFKESERKMKTAWKFGTVKQAVFWISSISVPTMLLILLLK